MLRNVYGWSKNSGEHSTFINLSGEAVKKTLLQKVGVQQKAEAESKAIMCPRCKCPNAPTAMLCVKCKSVLRLQDTVSISTVQKKLVEQNKTFEKMQGQIDMMMRAHGKRPAILRAQVSASQDLGKRTRKTKVRG